MPSSSTEAGDAGDGRPRPALGEHRDACHRRRGRRRRRRPCRSRPRRRVGRRRPSTSSYGVQLGRRRSSCLPASAARCRRWGRRRRRRSGRSRDDRHGRRRRRRPRRRRRRVAASRTAAALALLAVDARRAADDSVGAGVGVGEQVVERAAGGVAEHERAGEEGDAEQDTAEPVPSSRRLRAQRPLKVRANHRCSASQVP